MAPRDNYLLQAQQAKQHFLTYDQMRLARKLRAAYDGNFIYVNLLCQPYRIHRATGDIEKQVGDAWTDGNRYEEVMTLLDLVCDSREDRFLTGRWQNMEAFGHMFHRSLLEEARDPTAERYDRDPEGLERALQALNGRKIPGGDIGCAVELFDGLEIGLQFWRGDEEFAPRLRYLWDENANMYLRYETMYFATSLLRRRIGEILKKE